MVQYPLPSLVAIATGVLGSAWTSGTIGFFTLIGIPTALSLPAQQAHIWHGLFSHGMNLMPKVAATVAASFAYAAWDTAGRRGRWQGFAAGAVLTVAIVPFTFAFMSSTNSSLTSFVNGASVMSHEQVAGLIRKWSVLNAMRSLLPLAGAVVGSATLWSNIHSIPRV